MKEKIEQLKEILEEIEKGEGAYSRDVLKHAENTIENMKTLATKGLGILKEMFPFESV